MCASGVAPHQARRWTKAAAPSRASADSRTAARKASWRVTVAAYDEAADRWAVETDQGDVVRARFLFLATGCLSVARTPQYPGRDSFRGDCYHTGEWPHEPVDLAGKRVGVIVAGDFADPGRR